MRILIAHNRYQQPGAEDQVFTAEADLLADHGHEVIRYELHNNSIKSTGKLKVARNTIWNPQSAECGPAACSSPPDRSGALSQYFSRDVSLCLSRRA